MEAWQEFHFLRPWWFIALLPLLALVVLMRYNKRQASGWQRAIDPQLLSYLLDGSSQPARQYPRWLLALLWLLLVCALAGPTWQKLPQPVYKSERALVIVLDLSLSMLANDLEPTRLERSKHKLLDLLRQRNEGLTALVAYAGDAHTVAPLTDDTNTIAALVPALNPLIMPALGSNLSAAIERAQRLISANGSSRGDILLLTDGVTRRQAERVAEQLADNLNLAILAVGTAAGGPVPLPQQGFLKDEDGSVVLPKLDLAEIRYLAQLTGGHFNQLQISDADLKSLLPDYANGANALPADSALNDDQQAAGKRGTERQFDLWSEAGPGLVLVLLPFAALAFRRGWLLGPVLLLQVGLLQLAPQSASALSWQDLWQTDDQQAAKAFANGEHSEAAQQFEDPNWRASAQYRNGDYQAAVENFAGQNDATGHYNRANALAKAGQLQQAIDAYQEALSLDPNHGDAEFNKQLVEQLLQQQQSQNDQQQDGSGEGSEGDAKNPSANHKTQNSEQQTGESQNSQAENNQAQNNQAENNQAENNQAQNNQSDAQASQNHANPDQQDPNQAAQQQAGADGQEDQDTQNPANPQTAQPAEQEANEQQNQQENAGDLATSQQALNGSQEPPLDQEQKQALQQWLRRVPDDPGGLLRSKFRYEYQRRQAEGQGADQQEGPLW